MRQSPTRRLCGGPAAKARTPEGSPMDDVIRAELGEFVTAARLGRDAAAD